MAQQTLLIDPNFQLTDSAMAFLDAGRKLLRELNWAFGPNFSMKFYSDLYPCMELRWRGFQIMELSTSDEFYKKHEVWQKANPPSFIEGKCLWSQIWEKIIQWLFVRIVDIELNNLQELRQKIVSRKTLTPEQAQD